MTSCRSDSNMTLFDAHRIMMGDRPPGKTRAERDEYRKCAGTAFVSIASRRWKGPTSATLRPDQWDLLATTPSGQGAFLCYGFLPKRDLTATIQWIASAPAQHVELAVNLGSWNIIAATVERLHTRLLRGHGGPHARDARDAFTGAPVCLPGLIAALLRLPQQELEAMTAPHAGDWPCYADRLIASAHTWRDSRSEELFTALADISTEDAAEWAVWLGRFGLRGETMRLMARVPPSPQMLQIVQRFAKPDIARELLAALVGRQLQAEMPAGDYEPLPQAEMI
jgi:hypothetical protein